jgi:hypothetical protein
LFKEYHTSFLEEKNDKYTKERRQATCGINMTLIACTLFSMATFGNLKAVNCKPLREWIWGEHEQLSSPMAKYGLQLST